MTNRKKGGPIDLLKIDLPTFPIPSKKHVEKSADGLAERDFSLPILVIDDGCVTDGQRRLSVVQSFLAKAPPSRSWRRS